MSSDPSSPFAPARSVHTLALAALLLVACGERVIIGREPVLASADAPVDAGELPEPAADLSFEPEDEDEDESGGDDDTEESEEGDDSADESDGEDENP